MTKGRRPVKAINEAEEIAMKRGDVEKISGVRTSAFNLIINEPHRTVFVRVKRSRFSFTYPLEILRTYQRELAALHRTALTNVTAREFWVRSPKGTWQFFLVRHDSVVEIRADGKYVPPECLPMVVPDQPGTSADGAVDPASP